MVWIRYLGHEHGLTPELIATQLAHPLRTP
jgi:hypothetical protein